MKNADIVKLLFKDTTTTEQTCSLCNEVVRQKMQSGYKNLISHLQVYKDAADTYGWTELVALKNFPFGHIDDPAIHAAVRYKEMDRTTLLKRMTAQVGVVVIKIGEELFGEKFGPVLDGFTVSAEHAIAVFAATKKGFRFLAFSLPKASLSRVLSG
ncbi:hypothetical protein PR003_g5945 [Phytophthora rubi]|uniref:BED-type domain-containing protein n=1 Tax=Phytophthora rubi TaxID=129364 RepID=A0A6A3L8C6_9STRA|nr:hypothetical protein PR001_g15179 [Phytophthora rubi]KAE9349331.1 hypothetical protein PR003_g5945 [Phytophthora rubi]